MALKKRCSSFYFSSSLSVPSVPFVVKIIDSSAGMPTSTFDGESDLFVIPLKYIDLNDFYHEERRVHEVRKHINPPSSDRFPKMKVRRKRTEETFWRIAGAHPWQPYQYGYSGFLPAIALAIRTSFQKIGNSV